MTMPSRDLCDLLVTDWAESALLFPEIEQPALSFEGRCHVNVETFFKVAFPRWVIRIALSLDFHVPYDRHAIRVGEIPWLLIYCSRKHPVISFDGHEVFLRFPCIGFSWMSSIDPSSHHMIDR